MKALRALLALCVMAAAAIAVHQLCWTRYTCDVVKKRFDRRLSRAFRQGGELDRAAVGRTALRELQPCLQRDPYDYELRVTYGMAAQAAGQYDLAMAMYRAALALNERPEILANLAELQFELGQPEEAKRNLVRACSLSLAYARKVGEPMRSEIVAEVRARQARLSAAKQRRDDQPHVTADSP